jgi:hypothetical protein
VIAATAAFWRASSPTVESGLSFAVGGTVLDVFKADGFSVTSLTNAVNKMPYVPGRAGQVIDWNEQGIYTTALMIEEQSGTLTLINPTGAAALACRWRRTSARCATSTRRTSRSTTR